MLANEIDGSVEDGIDSAADGDMNRDKKYKSKGDRKHCC